MKSSIRRYSAQLVSTIVLLLTFFMGVGGNRRASAEEVVTENTAVRPRYGLNLDSASGGAEAFGQFESFIPIWQDIGSDIIFFQGQVSVDTDENLGTNLQLGYRHFNPTNDFIYGGYFAFDKRGINAGSFNQLGLGLEALGEDWDVRANGYIPLGDRSIRTGSSTADAGLQFTNAAFVGNQLNATAVSQQAEIGEINVAMGGFDVEVGKKLLNIGNHGALRGYSGLYYYDGGEDVDGSLGWRVRLQAEPTRYLRTGISVQNDDFFGTNFRFNIGAFLPSNRDVRSNDDSNNTSEAIARLGESLGRDGQIVVDRRTEVEIEAIQEDAVSRGPVINPETGEPWTFGHVVAEAENGDGTNEAPFSNIQDALDNVPTNGNGIVYVRDSDGATFSGGTSNTNPTEITRVDENERVNTNGGSINVPGGVRLLSSGPEQFIAAFNEASQIQLPKSGSGDTHTIQGNVSLSGSLEGLTEIAGFDISSNYSYAPSVGGASIFADAQQGDITIRDNSVNSVGPGIAVGSGGESNITITGNTVDARNSGIVVYNFGRGSVERTDEVDRSTERDFIALEDDLEESTSSITISGNTSIDVEAYNDGGLVGPFNGGIVVVNAPGTTIEGGVDISDNGPINVIGKSGDGGPRMIENLNEVNNNNEPTIIEEPSEMDEDDRPGVRGILILNGGVIEGGVRIADNESITVSGADTSDRREESITAISGTAGIVVSNYSYESSSIEGGITISGNTVADSSEYGIIVSTGNLSGSDEVRLRMDGSESFGGTTGDITIASNDVTSEDDSVLVVNTGRIMGSVAFTNNLLTSVEDDGIDVSNLSVDSVIEGDLIFSGNNITAGDDEVKCTNNGTIEGDNSSPSTCRAPLLEP